MHKFSLAAIFFSLVSYASAQNASAPWSDDRQKAVDQLGQSFVVPEEQPVINLDDVWMNWETVHNFAFGKNRGEIPMIVDLNALHPYFRDKIIELIAICKSKGIELAVVETYRTVAKQNEYKGLGKIYTRTSGGRSKHQYGLAIDVVPIVNSEAQWENIALWKKIGVVGEKLGLRWGGRWRHPFDPGHFEWSGGVSGVAMENGRTPVIPNAENYPSLNDDLAKLHVYWGRWENEQNSSLVARAKQSE
jgi:hypothetical protein